jgi:uncharacterized cupredoxin-like copper-binding protein
MIATYRTLVISLLVLLGAAAAGPANAEAVMPPASAPADAVDWARALPVFVVLGEFHYEPSRIILRRGQPYVLRLQNAGRFSHTFTAPSFFRAVQFRQERVGEDIKASGGVVVAAGEAVEIRLVPLQPGRYALECTKPLHGLFGMSGDIVVE